MTNSNGKNGHGSTSGRVNGLGPVAREKYEAILQARVQSCIAAQEAKIHARREDALRRYLEQHELVSKIAVYRATLENLVAILGEPDWRYPAWLRDDSALLNHPKVEKGLQAVQRSLPELKPVFAELDRLHRFEAQIAEKVWLAGAPDEIAELLRELGEPTVEETRL